jgi:hypothetical protein
MKPVEFVPRGRIEEGGAIGEMGLAGVHYTHVWNHHNKLLCTNKKINIPINPLTGLTRRHIGGCQTE